MRCDVKIHEIVLMCICVLLLTFWKLREHLRNHYILIDNQKSYHHVHLSKNEAACCWTDDMTPCYWTTDDMTP
jgi:hypothetical protein